MTWHRKLLFISLLSSYSRLVSWISQAKSKSPLHFDIHVSFEHRIDSRIYFIMHHDLRSSHLYLFYLILFSDDDTLIMSMMLCLFSHSPCMPCHIVISRIVFILLSAYIIQGLSNVSIHLLGCLELSPSS